jgi:hypothetical protein
MTTEDHDRDAPYQDFDEVFGSAIDVAVRRAVDRIGRDPMGDLDPSDGQQLGVVEQPPSPAVAVEAEEEPQPGVEPDAATTGARRRRLEDGADGRPDLPLPKGRLDGVNPYAVLGVSQSASWEQITAAYRRRARAWHPDGAEPAEAARRQELIRQLNVAYSRLREMRDRRLH